MEDSTGREIPGLGCGIWKDENRIREFWKPTGGMHLLAFLMQKIRK